MTTILRGSSNFRSYVPLFSEIGPDFSTTYSLDLNDIRGYYYRNCSANKVSELFVYGLHIRSSSHKLVKVKEEVIKITIKSGMMVVYKHFPIILACFAKHVVNQSDVRLYLDRRLLTEELFFRIRRALFKRIKEEGLLSNYPDLSIVYYKDLTSLFFDTDVLPKFRSITDIDRFLAEEVPNLIYE